MHKHAPTSSFCKVLRVQNKQKMSFSLVICVNALKYPLFDSDSPTLASLSVTPKLVTYFSNPEELTGKDQSHVLPKPKQARTW